jgi:murein L,D-transpeptidase YafK
LPALLLTAALCAGFDHAHGMSYLPVLAPPTPAPVDARTPQKAAAGMADRVVIKKAERRLYLMQGDRPMRTYDIALGYQPIGHKAREGDGRTPEGRYTLDWRSAKSRFHKALHVSYPSAQDERRAAHRGENAGGMILIHGQPSSRDGATRIEGDWTLGCIAVSDAEIDEIWKLTRDGTPIEILP